MQTPKKFSSFSDQVSWISDEKGIKIKDREYAEEMLRQIGYFPLMGGYKHLFRISNTKKYKAGTSFEEIVSLYKFDAELRELFFKYLLQIERQMRSLCHTILLKCMEQSRSNTWMLIIIIIQKEIMQQS